MITVTHLAEKGRQLVTGGEEELDAPGLLWIDVEKPSQELLEKLASRFRLHKLAIEDCLHLDQRPKLEEYPHHQFLVLHGFSAGDEDPCELTMHEVHMFIGQEWVISVHDHLVPAIAEARKRLAADPQNTFARGVDFIVYTVTDELVDGNFDIIDKIETSIEELEDDVFEGPNSEQLVRLSRIRRAVVTLRRVLSPQRDMVSLLARGSLPFVQERTTLYFRDVFDHLIRLHEQIESARDLLANAREAWLASVANRTNEITKQLTIFATIFLPLSFITGFFGQNFEVLSKPIFFWSMLAMIALLPVVLLVWFRRSRWLG